MVRSSREKEGASGQTSAGGGGAAPSQILHDTGPPHRTFHRTQHLNYYLAASVSVITFLVYLSALQNKFVNFDDPAYVYENPHIRSLDFTFFKWAFFDFYASNWHPLTWISHALDYAVWGLTPLGHHLTNNILHAVNTFLVVVLVVRLLEAVHDSQFTIHDSRFALISAGVTGLLFGLHPIHVESVAWVSERKDLLCGLFFLLSVMAYVKYAGKIFLSFPQSLSSRVEDRGNPSEMALNTGIDSGSPDVGDRQAGMTKQGLRYLSKHYLLAICFFVLALLSKPMAVTLPVVLLILDWYPFKRVNSLKSFRYALTEKLPFIACSLGSSVLTVLAQRTKAMEIMEFVPFQSRLLVAAKALISYLWNMTAPVDLSPFYPYPTLTWVTLFSMRYLFTVFLVVGLTVSAFAALKKQRLWLSAWGYYVITLMPVLGIIQVGYQCMADRYTYLPSIGPFLLAGLGAAWLFYRAEPFKIRGVPVTLICTAGFLVVVAVMTYGTVKQIALWKDTISLWTRVIDNEKGRSPLAYSFRGLYFASLGQYDKAIEDFSKGINVLPSSDLYHNRASAFMEIGRLDEAVRDFDKALALNPSDYGAYIYQGSAFLEMGQFDKAIADFDKAIAWNPRSYEAYNNKGMVYGKTGLLDKAIEQFNKAVGINPDFSLAYGNRGFAYSLLGEDARALQDLNKAIALDNNYAEAYGTRGNLYLKTGNSELAISDFQKACDLGETKGCDALQAVQLPIK